MHAELLIVAGFVAGVMSGLLGIGGGILLVPVLVYAASLDQRHAIATSLVAIIPMAIAGAWRQRSYGNLDLPTGVRLGALGLVGSVIGASLANVLPDRALRIGFALLMLFVAFEMIRSLFRPPSQADADGAAVPAELE